MRLIDADRLKAEIMGWCVVPDDLFGMGRYHEREIVLQAIEESPTIDPAKRGKWERMVNAYGELEGFACECGIGPDDVGILFVDMAGYSVWNRRAKPDAAPVVRCKECENYNTTGFPALNPGTGWCDKMDRGTHDDFYCSCGERKEIGGSINS